MAVLQSNDYKKNLAIFRPTGASANRGYEPTESQLREVLEKQGAKAIGGSSKQKKALAVRFYELQKEILKDVYAVDSSNRTDLASETKKIFSAWSSKKKINNIVKKEIAANMLKVFHIVAIIDAHLREKEYATSIRVTRADVEKKKYNKSKKDQLYEDILQLKEEVTNEACKRANESQPNSQNYLIRGEKLESSMVGREFDRSLIPKDSAHWDCAYCGCMSTNTVPEDAGAVDRNTDIIAYWKLCDKLWSTYQERRKKAQDAGLPEPLPPKKPNATWSLLMMVPNHWD